ncbi:lysylphosphatidylglycerol synthase transmembrane domain-containing protein [Halogranum amylolyticum]|uniref:lysylphosphatidylglycerol synthase transmembrane domain-containing protein n=1 Tax=Halogranum amylolyticum TaxID=660520 RepID=UPI00147BED56|nr:lysylphosphatidylglycerol synthase transmembrane domain-containing protein [Halogranum amylolyticum]
MLRSVGGLILGALVLFGYFSLVGFEDVRRVLWTVPPRRLLSLLVVSGVPLFVWGAGLHLVFDRLKISVRFSESLLLFSAAGFLNGVTPFGQAGGDPLAAVLFKRAVEVDFETGIAAIGSVNALNRVAAVFLGLIGVGYLESRVAVSGNLRTVTVFVTVLSVLLALSLVVAWWYRDGLVELAAAVLTPLVHIGARVVPGATPPSREALERRGHRFVAAIDRLASDPGRLAVVFSLGIAGHLAVASTLWVALAVLGFDAPMAVVLLVIPLAKLSGIAPTPGGFGSAEALLGTLLVSTTAVGAPVAGAAALLYRASAFWVPSFVGGLAVGWFVVTGNEHSAGTQPPRDAPSDVDGMVASDSDDWFTPGSRATVPRILLAVTVSISVLSVVVLHRSHILVEPNSILVHVIRDTSVVVVSFVLTWVLLNRLSRG